MTFPVLIKAEIGPTGHLWLAEGKFLRIARSPTPQLSLRFDSRATQRKLLPAALASVPFGFVLVRVRVLASAHKI
jgi:hypothetical protein